MHNADTKASRAMRAFGNKLKREAIERGKTMKKGMIAATDRSAAGKRWELASLNIHAHE